MNRSEKFKPHQVRESLNQVPASENRLQEPFVFTHDAALLFNLGRIHSLMLHARKNTGDQRVLYWEASQYMLEDLMDKLQKGECLPGEQTQLF